jgi:hypothetical protein
VLETTSPAGLGEALTDLGHQVTVSSIGSTFGHAHAIVVEPDGEAAGGADHRALIGSAEAA